MEVGAAAAIAVWRDMGLAPIPQEREAAKVVIVGAGPVGLSLALDLGRRGHSVVVLTKLTFIAAGSKAICFSKRTLDIWNRLGVGDAMLAKGVGWDIGKVFWGCDSKPIYQFDLAPLKAQKMPAFINLQQYHVESMLVDALQVLPNVDIRWGHEVTSLLQTREGVIAGVTLPDGEYAVETDWLIACDGSRSPVRTLLGLDFEGRVFEDNFLIADIKLKDPRPAERCFWFDPPFNPGQSALLHKQPDDVWRLDFQLGWNIDRDACTRPGAVEPLVRGMLGEDVEFTKEWYSVYTFQCRRMERFVHDRIVFAGDSAHLVSPFGARGCNGGVADVDNLGWKLDLVIRAAAPVELLQSYQQEAIETADENILHSTRSTDFLTPKSDVSRAFRDAVLSLSKTHPVVRRFINSGRLSTAVRYVESPLSTQDEINANWEGLNPGSPSVDAAWGDEWLLDLLGGDFVLLARDWPHEVPSGVRVLDTNTLVDAQDVVDRYDLRPGSAYLIRPDQYVAARWRNPEFSGISDSLARAQGRHR